MESALQNACVGVQDVGYVNAHATSTPVGDAAEAAAIRRILGDHCSKVAVSATKGSTGHLLGSCWCHGKRFHGRGLLRTRLEELQSRTRLGSGGTNGSLVIAEYRK
ncbi:hypothetical protein MRX96_037370 [Rhipicephalus microplus]